MRYFLIIFTIIISFFMSACKKETDKKAVEQYISEIMLFMDNISKNPQANDIDIFHLEYKQALDDTLNKILNNIYEIESLKKYNKEHYEVIRSNAVDELYVFINNSRNDNKTSKEIAKKYINMIKIYTEPLKSLYSFKIDVNDYLHNYKEAFCVGNDCGHNQQLIFFDNIKEYLATLDIDEKDIWHNIINNAELSYTLYSLTYYFIGKDSIDNSFITEHFNQQQKDFYYSLLNYKISKSLKSVYLSKIYLQLLLSDKEFSKKIKLDSNNISDESYAGELVFERDSMLYSGCTNPRFLLTSTLNECINLIESTDNKEDAFSYLEDENSAGFVMIDDNICAENKDNKYKFYNNDNIICKSLKKIIEN